MDKTNLIELAAFFPASSGRTEAAPQRLTLLPASYQLAPGESYADAVAKREENARRINAKLAAKQLLRLTAEANQAADECAKSEALYKSSAGVLTPAGRLPLLSVLNMRRAKVETLNAEIERLKAAISCN